jgi:hypothetical protein
MSYKSGTHQQSVPKRNHVAFEKIESSFILSEYVDSDSDNKKREEHDIGMHKSPKCIWLILLFVFS